MLSIFASVAANLTPLYSKIEAPHSTGHGPRLLIAVISYKNNKNQSALHLKHRFNSTLIADIRL
jgi:hypothetical protein